MLVNKSLERYKEIYSEYVECRVTLHNYHVNFLSFIGRESYYKVRKTLARMPKLERDLRLAAKAAYEEQLKLNVIIREEKRNSKKKK